MAIKVKCPECKKSLAVRDEFAGRRVRCKSCEAVLSVPMPKDDTDDPFDDLGDINDFAGGDELPPKRSRNRSTKKTKRRSEESMSGRLPSFNFSLWSVLYSVVAVIGLFGLFVPQILIWLLLFGLVFQFVTGLIGTIGVLATIGRNSGWALVGLWLGVSQFPVGISGAYFSTGMRRRSHSY